MTKDLITLPIAIQVAIASGYIAYLLAFSGNRAHHTTTDVVLRTFVFSALATVAFGVFANKPIFGAISAFFSAIAAGLLWRTLLSRLTRWLLRKSNLIWADDTPNAWLTITTDRTDQRPSQLLVELVNGKLLFCENTRLYQDAPFGPCIFGLDGSIAMYVSATRMPGQKWQEEDDVLHDEEGARITHIPASQIRRTEIRFWSSQTRAAAKFGTRKGKDETSSELSA